MYQYHYKKIGDHTIGYLDNKVQSETTLIALHGFPELALSWSDFMQHYEKKNIRVIAPDLLGYAHSPAHKKPFFFKIDNMTEIYAEFAKSFDSKKIHLIGHDWGGILTWNIAHHYSDTFDKIIILNAPHWHLLKTEAMKNPRQLLKSWYFAFFQIPFIPELILRSKDYALLTNILREQSGGKMSDELIAKYKEGWNKNLTSMLNWYRSLKYILTIKSANKIKNDVLVIMTDRDPFFIQGLGYQSLNYCEQGHCINLQELHHFPIHEDLSTIVQHIDHFLDDNR